VRAILAYLYRHPLVTIEDVVGRIEGARCELACQVGISKERLRIADQAIVAGIGGRLGAFVNEGRAL
jgi:hypothetical protein